MSEQNRPEEYPKWTTICKRVSLWKERPGGGSWLKRFWFLSGFYLGGPSDSGRIEYNGDILRFTGKKSQMEIPATGEISEVRVRFKLVQLLLCFCLYGVLVFGTYYGVCRLNYWVLWDPLRVPLILGLALLFTVSNWLYVRKYGGWVRTSFSTLDGQPREAYFWAAPISGGSQKLYNDLSKLDTFQLCRK
jgi:hypothetical protein